MTAGHRIPRLWQRHFTPAGPAICPGGCSQTPARPSKDLTAMTTPSRVSSWLDAEWLEADGLGGFASGTVGGIRTRRYHALLLAATTPPTGRVVLVNGFDAWLETAGGPLRALAQRYAPGRRPSRRREPDRSSFAREPWPRWIFRCRDGTRSSRRSSSATAAARSCVRWRLARRGRGPRAPRSVRPLLSGRDYHALHHENPALRLRRRASPATRVAVAALRRRAGGRRARQRQLPPRPDWYRNFLYDEERARGLDFTRGPGRARRLQLRPRGTGEAVLILAAAATSGGPAPDDRAPARATLEARARAARLRVAARARGRRLPRAARQRQDDRRRLSLVHRLGPRHVHRAARALPRHGRPRRRARRSCSSGRARSPRACCRTASPTAARRPSTTRSTPRSGSWSRCTSCLAAVGRGAADVSAASAARARRTPSTRSSPATRAARATASASTTTACSPPASPGVQLTWMDAKVGDWVVTPRIGKPVEVQALWLNALRDRPARRAASGARCSSAARAASFAAALLERGARLPLRRRRRRPRAGPQRPGVPARTRSSRSAACPSRCSSASARARSSTRSSAQLLTPLGLRSLAPGEPGYAAALRRRRARARRRLPPGHGLALAARSVRRGLGARARRHAGGEARGARTASSRRCSRISSDAGLGHVSEIADGDPPHTPRGCPFQAWSVGELLRLARLLADQRQTAPTACVA